MWGVHLAWSGNQVHAAERMHHGEAVLTAGELLLPREATVAPGDTHTAPTLWASHGHGLNELAGRLHDEVRARPGHPRTPRRVLFNSCGRRCASRPPPSGCCRWSSAAAAVGAERFVVDDGWFRGRTGARAALGDWELDRERWPDGLDPLVEKVTAAGMELGLWVEPEMVNTDSDLARAHPDWLLRPGPGDGPDGLGLPSRFQHVLDLAHPDAYAHIAKALHALLDAWPIGYLKWDHNRPVTEAGHGPTRSPGVRAHTLAAYRLMDELKAVHPGLEIESCASGGARIDLGVLARTDRVWASDCIDALDRQEVQRWTQLLRAARARRHPPRPGDRPLHRPDAAAGAAGHDRPVGPLRHRVESRRPPARGPPAGPQLGRPAQVAATAAPLRARGGRRPARPDPVGARRGRPQRPRGRVRPDVARQARHLARGRVRLPGLDPDTSYDVGLLPPDAAPEPPWTVPSWLADGRQLPGRVLGTSGVQVPAMKPQQATLLHLTRAR